MMQITSAELREKFQCFMESKGHHRIQSASVIPENDPTVLFTTAGMHPLVPYLMGTPHPAGTRLTDVQKCIRTGDIEDVGDPSHLTFFEMLGNWSLGDYFKEQAIAQSWEFLTSEKYLGLDKDHLAFTVFAGDEDCPRDTESHDIWRSMGVAEDHIFYLPKSTTGGAPPASPAPAARTPRCSSSATSRRAAPTALPPATAAAIWRSGTTSSCSTTSRLTAPLCPWPRRTWTPAWAWSAPSVC